MSKEAMHYSNSQNIDKEKLSKMLPKGTHHKVTDEVISLIHSMEEDTGLLQDYLEESLLSYLPVLKETKVDLSEYVNAIKFCNLKKNMSNEKAWQIVFPEKYKKLYEEGRWNTSHPSMYNSSTLVVKLDAQMMVAVHIQYAPYFHASVKKQYELMNGVDALGLPVSPTVQHLAAKALGELTAQPIDTKVELKIGQSDEAKDSQAKMFGAMNELAKNQRELLKAGHSLEDVQKLNITIEVDEDDGDTEYAEIVGE